MTGETSEITDVIPVEVTSYGQDLISVFGPPCLYIRR